MKVQQTGFTLIELVVVIVILGILSAVALPRFINLSGEAAQSAAQGVAGAVSSATAINYAARKASATAGVAIGGCATAASAVTTLLTGGLPTGYALEGTSTCTDGGSTTCTVRNNNVSPSRTADAVVVCSN